MKIIQSSNIALGKSFSGTGLPGNKFRAGLKAGFSRVIDLTLSEKADLLVLAGDTFDGTAVSQNLLNFFLREIARLENIPVVILPGLKDPYHKGSFWEEWSILHTLKNLYPLTVVDEPFIEFPHLSTTIYGLPVIADRDDFNPLAQLQKQSQSSYHIAVVYGNLTNGDSVEDIRFPLQGGDIIAGSFDYVALGGQDGCRSYCDIGMRAAYSGAPETLGWGRYDSGNVLLVNIEDNNVVAEPRKIGTFDWQETQIPMETVINWDDLKVKIGTLAGPDVVLKATLQGLALLETGFDTARLCRELQNDFLYLEIIDKTEVLPDNVSAVRVQEKTIIGQYLKIMVDKINKADDSSREMLEESLKSGYTILTGREIW